MTTEPQHEPDLQFLQQLTEFGFELTQRTRGYVAATLVFNRFLTFTVYDYGDCCVLSWVVQFGAFAETQGWMLGVTDTSTAELYPRADVRLARDSDAVRAEITRVLTTLRVDLGDLAH